MRTEEPRSVEDCRRMAVNGTRMKFLFPQRPKLDPQAPKIS
jgi:hypothetical protein